MNSFEEISSYITDHLELLAEDLVDTVIQRLNTDIPDMERKQAILMYKALLDFFAESLHEGAEDDIPEAVLRWSKQNAEHTVTREGKISEIVSRYPPTRNVFAEFIKHISVDFNVSISEHSLMVKLVNNILDISLNETIIAYERFYEQYREAAQKALDESSAPIVPVEDGIVVLPFVGDFNENRARYMLEKVVPKVAGFQGVDYVITDFSGVYMINEQITTYFHQIGKMLRLMGIQIIVTGMRPELVKTAVRLGIDLSDVQAFTTVKQALKSLDRKNVVYE